MDEIYDIAVIGGGPAGYVAAIRGAQLGGKVVLFERDSVGGTCLNRGCVPTKTLVKTSDSIAMLKRAAASGISINDAGFTVDMKKIVARKDDIVKKLTGGVAGLLRSNGVKVVSGEALLTSAGTVECGGVTYCARSVILCTGSKPVIPPIPGADCDKVVTSNELLDVDELPEKLVIIGAGIIGCEFAFPFARFGSHVTVIESAPRVTPMLDMDQSEGIRKGMLAHGVTVLTSTRVDSIIQRDGKTCVKAGELEIEADMVVVAVGRSPVCGCLDGLETRPQMSGGHIVVDDQCKTSIDGLYACGDITDRAYLASAAFKMGECAAMNAMGHTAKLDLRYVPNCIHADPEAASVGLTEQAAREQYGDELMVGKFPFNGNGMALASSMPEGFVKVLAEKRCGEILGVHILGADATEMISEVCDLLSAELTIYEAADILHPHPSYSEAFMEACADALGRCIHLPKKHK